ncbi:MAG: protein-L-isoaspartate(D-aspartate) O-methyltransferase [Motiliproteus sp.]
MQQMIADIEAEVDFTAKMIGRHRLSDRVMAAMRQVPRHVFVADSLLDDAYDNRPLPIGYGQTISQPYMVAVMTDLLEPGPNQRILEIGCGSGYQAAVLSLLVARVISLEIIASLADSARQRLARLGYPNVEVIEADGSLGWQRQAPYDGIIVTAAPDAVPQPLIDQLAPNGHLIIPVGAHPLSQQLLDIYKAADGSVIRKALLPVRFVPLTGGVKAGGTNPG